MPRPHGSVLLRPVKGARYRAWQTMRVFRKAGKAWTYRELAAAADAGVDNVRLYVRELEARGIVARVSRRRPRDPLGDILWKLVRDLGPEPPIPRKRGGLYDPNSGEELP